MARNLSEKVANEAQHTRQRRRRAKSITSKVDPQKKTRATTLGHQSLARKNSGRSQANSRQGRRKEHPPFLGWRKKRKLKKAKGQWTGNRGTKVVMGEGV